MVLFACDRVDDLQGVVSFRAGVYRWIYGVAGRLAIHLQDRVTQYGVSHDEVR